jgi:hypothetical protein
MQSTQTSLFVSNLFDVSSDRSTPKDLADLPQSGDLETRINRACLNIAANRGLDSGH